MVGFSLEQVQTEDERGDLRQETSICSQLLLTVHHQDSLHKLVLLVIRDMQTIEFAEDGQAEHGCHLVCKLNL